MCDVLPSTTITAANVALGEISLNPADIRGEGGLSGPVIVVPLEVRLTPRPKAEQVAVLALEADLTQGNQPIRDRIGTDVRDLRPGMQVVSTEWGTPIHRIELRFPVLGPALEQLELRRHASDGRLSMSLSFRLVLAWLRAHNEVGQAPEASNPFDMRHGMLADLTLFWSPAASDLSFVVEQNTWVTQVLPELGYDKVRLVEVRLPTELDDELTRAAFGRQLRHLDLGGYRESIAASRDLLHAWEKRLGATQKHPVAAVVADGKGWDEEDPRRRFLDQLWSAAKNLPNTVLHEANQPTMLNLGEPETRMHVLLTAALSEWLTELTD